MEIYDMHAESDRKWVWFFTKNNLALPPHPWEEEAFFNAHPKIAIDRNTEATPRGSSAKLADYSDLNYNGYPIFSERARRIFGPHIDGLGRWIELEYDEAPYWLFWITNVVDALDGEQSELKRFADGKVMRIVSYAFKPAEVRDQWLFTLPQRRGSNRLVTQRFIDLVHQHQLTGFLFQRLWSSETGPVSSKLKDWEKPRITGLEQR
jgi:hypothetical protein